MKAIGFSKLKFFWPHKKLWCPEIKLAVIRFYTSKPLSRDGARFCGV